MALPTALMILLAALKFKFSRNESIFQYITRKYDASCLRSYRALETKLRKLKKTELDLDFLLTCKLCHLVPNFVKFKLYKRTLYSTKFYENATQTLLDMEIRTKQRVIKRYQEDSQNLEKALKTHLTFLDVIFIMHCMNNLFTILFAILNMCTQRS